MRLLRRILPMLATAIMTSTIFATSIGADARKIRTKLPVKYVEAKSDMESPEPGGRIIINENDSAGIFDRINAKIRFYGFDKTVGASKESFFIINGSDTTLTSAIVEITYFDMHRRQLHQATMPIDCIIPAGETRRVDIKSWDTQKSFYFHQSAKPRRQATPFDVTIRLKSVTLFAGEESVID